MSTWSLRLFPRRNRVRWQALTDEELYLTMKGKTMLHLRRISIALLLGGSVLGAILVGAVTHTFAAGNASNASVITGVAFTGTSDQPGPTVTVTGHGNPFGHNPPTGHDNSTTNCGPYKNNGDDYGTTFNFLDKTRVWQASSGIPPAGNCIGIIVLSWKPNEVVFKFGSAYGSFDDWFAREGDRFHLTMKGAVFTGTVYYT